MLICSIVYAERGLSLSTGHSQTFKIACSKQMNLSHFSPTAPPRPPRPPGAQRPRPAEPERDVRDAGARLHRQQHGAQLRADHAED